jgi:hypothetical protein
MNNETNKPICRECRTELGYIPKDDGFHTAQLNQCCICGELKLILPSRYWVKKEQTK